MTDRHINCRSLTILQSIIFLSHFSPTPIPPSFSFSPQSSLFRSWSFPMATAVATTMTTNAAKTESNAAKTESNYAARPESIVARTVTTSEKNVMDDYEKLEKVGEGSYGKVYRAKDKRTGQIVALKKTRLREDEEGVPPTTLREVSLLKCLSKDPHVVRLLEVRQGQSKEGKTVLYLVFEFMDADLKKYIRSFRQTKDKMPVKTVKSIMYQLCKGLCFIHSHGVLHRDLKPHNLLMDKKTVTLKIADFGLSRAFTVPLKKYTHEILTLWYRAPEILLGTNIYSTSVDMWSVGCIFAELVTTLALFAGDSELQQLLYIFRLLGTPNEEIWPGVTQLRNWHVFPQWKPSCLSTLVPGLDPVGLDLLGEMLKYEPVTRISAKKAMDHPYFDDLDKTGL